MTPSSAAKLYKHEGMEGNMLQTKQLRYGPFMVLVAVLGLMAYVYAFFKLSFTVSAWKKRCYKLKGGSLMISRTSDFKNARSVPLHPLIKAFCIDNCRVVSMFCVKYIFLQVIYPPFTMCNLAKRMESCIW